MIYKTIYGNSFSLPNKPDWLRTSIIEAEFDELEFGEIDTLCLNIVKQGRVFEVILEEDYDYLANKT